MDTTLLVQTSLSLLATWRTTCSHNLFMRQIPRSVFQDGSEPRSKGIRKSSLW